MSVKSATLVSLLCCAVVGWASGCVDVCDHFMGVSCTPSDDDDVAASSECVAPSSSAPFAEGSGQPRSSHQIHVSAGAPTEDGDGTSEHPFASLTAALRGRAPGDYVIVHGGVYDECPTIRDIHGTREEPIWITGYGPVSVRCPADDGVTLESVSNVALEHLRIETATRGARSIRVAGQSDHVRIGSNEFDSIAIGDTTGAVVTGNRIANPDGIVVASSRDVLVSFNQFQDDGRATVTHSGGVRVECNSGAR